MADFEPSTATAADWLVELDQRTEEDPNDRWTQAMMRLAHLPEGEAVEALRTLELLRALPADVRSRAMYTMRTALRGHWVPRAMDAQLERTRTLMQSVFGSAVPDAPLVDADQPLLGDGNWTVEDGRGRRGLQTQPLEPVTAEYSLGDFMWVESAPIQLGPRTRIPTRAELADAERRAFDRVMGTHASPEDAEFTRLQRPGGRLVPGSYAWMGDIRRFVVVSRDHHTGDGDCDVLMVFDDVVRPSSITYSVTVGELVPLSGAPSATLVRSHYGRGR